MRFDPQIFPNRTILIDTTIQPPAEKMDCVACGRLSEKLYKCRELCSGCYEKWEERFREAWIRTRFGGETRPPVS